MKMWHSFRRRLEKYENLANSKKETEKVWKPGIKKVLEDSTRFSYFFCYVYEGFFMFTGISYFFNLLLKIRSSDVQL